MEHREDPSRDSLALARKHVRALTDGGVSREALLRALLEQEEASSNLPPLPSQQLPSQPQLRKSNSLSRALSLSRSKSKSPWPVPSNGAPRAKEEGNRPPSSDQVSTSTGHSGSRGSFVSTHTTATTLSSRSSTITQFPGAELPGTRPASASTRAYWCTSCDTEFKRKFDWKRHEDEFHERYKKYPCPDCNRVFWGANTFNQHHKTRHNCKTCPHADKVIKYTRKKRAWACGFCAAFLPSMDRYIDHIGLHYESGRTKAHWYHSNVIYGLLHQPGVNAAWKNIIGSRFSHIPKGQQPRYGWDPKTTGREQGFLENETAGNLQDLLEFFNPTKDDPAKIARLAFDFAELTPANQAASSIEHAPPPPPPGPKREHSSASKTSYKRKQSGPVLDLAPPPAVKERPLTQWPGIYTQPDLIPEMPQHEAQAEMDDDVKMHDYDATAVPQPLFASSLSPPPSTTIQDHHHSEHQTQQGGEASSHSHPPSIAISISPCSDQPTFLTPTTPLPPTPTTPFPGPGGNMSRDTVVDLLSEYMTHDQLQGDHPDMQSHLAARNQHHQQQQQPLCQHPPFEQYDDWNSICSTMVNSVASPRHNGPPLPPAPHDQQQEQARRSDFWAPAPPPPHNAAAAATESLYMDNVQACDLASISGPPQPIQQQQQQNVRRSDVWAASVDYEGMGYENEVAPPPPATTNWL